MSDEEKQTESKEESPLVDLTSLEFGPAWARSDAGGKKKTEKKHKEWAAKEERGGKRSGGGGRDFRGGGQRDHRGGGQRDQRGGGRRDNRGGGRGDQRGRGRHDSRDRHQRQEVPAPEGVVAQVMPVEDGLDNLAKEILAAGRTYAVFDLAKLVLGARERFNVGFKCEGDKKLYRCRKDGSVWLSKADAIQGFWNGQWRKDYYEQVFSDAEPPKGNFQAVAKCGFSGELLGPPNYHGYQSAIMQLYQERFSNMSIDAYKRKIQMDRGEEAVAAWMEKMSKKVQYRPTGGKAPEPEVKEESAEEGAVKEEAPVEGEAEVKEPEAAAEAPVEKVAAPEAVAEAAVEEVAAEDAVAEEKPAEEEEGGAEAPAEGAAAEEAPAEEAPAEGAPAEEAPAEEAPAEEGAAEAPVADEELLDDLKAVERHFVENHFDEVYQETPKAWVPGGIPGNLLSPGLLTLLRQTVAEERRYPGKLTPMLCRQLSGRHVAVFKWRKKLKAGPARPHAVPEDIVLADRPQQLLTWLKANSGKKLEDLWKDVLPEGADDTLKHAWYHDLHWVLNQGYALLISDSTLHMARTGEGGAPKGKKKGGSEKGEGKQPEGKKPEGKQPEGKKPEGKQQESEKQEAGKEQVEGEEAKKEAGEEQKSEGEGREGKDLEASPAAEKPGEEDPRPETPVVEVAKTEASAEEAPVVEAPADETPAGPETPAPEASKEPEAPSGEEKGG